MAAPHFHFRHQSVACLSVIILVMACSESIVDPVAERKLPPVTKSLVSSTYGSEITVVDEQDGTQWTLNIDQQQIHQSGGKILHLDLDQTAAMASVFSAIVDADNIINDMEGAGMSCSAHPEACEEPTIVQPGDPGSEEVSARSAFSLTAPSRINANRISSAAYEPVQSSNLHFKTTGPRFTMYSSGDICSDIVNAALPKKFTYRQIRTRLVKRAFSDAVQEFVGQMIDFVLDAPAWAQIKNEGVVADHLDAAIGVGYLAGMWNTYSCQTRNVYAGPVWRWTGFEQGDIGVIKVCRWEPAWVSFNNQDWYEIELYVCEWQRK